MSEVEEVEVRCLDPSQGHEIGQSIHMVAIRTDKSNVNLVPTPPYGFMPIFPVREGMKSRQVDIPMGLSILLGAQYSICVDAESEKVLNGAGCQSSLEEFIEYIRLVNHRREEPRSYFELTLR